MDLVSALDELPEAHAAAIRMQRAGADPAAIATELGIEVEAVTPLLQVAEAKLASLLAASDPPGTRGPPSSGQQPEGDTPGG
jgi:DNA-directed RNA polymerase specialized sigma24 family protein